MRTTRWKSGDSLRIFYTPPSYCDNWLHNQLQDEKSYLVPNQGRDLDWDRDMSRRRTPAIDPGALHFDGLAPCAHCYGHGQEILRGGEIAGCERCGGTGVAGDRSHPYFAWARIFVRPGRDYAGLLLDLARSYHAAGFALGQASAAMQYSWPASRGVASEEEMRRWHDAQPVATVELVSRRKK